MNEKLKPCPFCGHSAHIERHGDRGRSTIYQCDFCSCRLETGEEWGHGKQWNERAALTPDPAVNGGAVKPLDWTEVFGNGYEIDWRGKGVFGTYAARAVRAYDMVLANGRYYATIDQAKSSIQLDYERRILSALTSPQGEETPAAPSPQADVVVDAPQWQLDDARIKRLMEQCGMPDSMSVYQAMKQLVMETELSLRKQLSEPCSPENTEGSADV